MSCRAGTGLVGLEYGPEFFPRQVAVAQDLREQAGTDRLPTVNRYDRTAAIRVPQEMMASSDPNQNEALLVQGFDETLTGERRKVAHTGTVTRWTPTNWFTTGSSTSRQRAIASCTRFIRTSRDFAWV